MFRKFTTTLAISVLLISGVGPALAEAPIADQKAPVVATQQVAKEQAPLPAAGAATVQEAQLTGGQWWAVGLLVVAGTAACIAWCGGSDDSTSGTN